MAPPRGNRPGNVSRRSAAIADRSSGTESAEHRLRALRRSSNSSTAARLFLATLRIRIPRTLWTGPFSSGHPDVRLEILNRVEVTPDVSVSDFWIDGGPPGVWAQEISGYPDILSVDSLAEVGSGSLYRIKYRNPPVVYLYRRLQLPLHFPLRMQAGYLGWEIVARYSEFQEIMKHVRSADPTAQIVSIRRGPLRSHLPLLSEAQHRLLTEAMAAGYFAVPRGITLTALARKLNRSKSGISEAIALIEKKLLEAALRPPVSPA
jgi:hypothetical protein